MSDSNALFQKFLQVLAQELGVFIEGQVTHYQQATKADANAFLLQSEQDLQRLLGLLSQGLLTRDEFAFLMNAKKDVVELKALQQLGLSQVFIDKIWQGVLQTIIRVAFSVAL